METAQESVDRLKTPDMTECTVRISANAFRRVPGKHCEVRHGAGVTDFPQRKRCMYSDCVANVRIVQLVNQTGYVLVIAKLIDTPYCS